jgi:DNA-binding PadR family transcriptional regulator
LILRISHCPTADFNFLLSTLAMTNGNLSRHTEKLESAGYIKTNKAFKGKMPNTSYQLTKKGARALTEYWKELDVIRRTGLT